MTTPFGGAPYDTFERERLSNVRPPDWSNPQPASRYKLLVIGAGTAGLVAAKGAAALGARVALIERDLIGGDCLNVGCVPSKALIRTARLYAEMRNAAHYGACAPADVQVDFAAAMARMRRLRSRISRWDSINGLAAAGVDVFLGHARFVSGDTVDVDGIRLRFDKAVIATGSRPDTPSVPGLGGVELLTNENIFDLTELPPPTTGDRRRPAGLRAGPGVFAFRRQDHHRTGDAVLPAQRRARRRAAALRRVCPRRPRGAAQHHRHRRLHARR